MLNAHFFSKIRVKVAQVTSFFLLVYCFFINPIEIAPLQETKGVIGAIIALLGALVRSLSAGYINKNKFLASQGLYALTRNPLYFGSFLIVVGLNIVIWNPLVASITTLIFAMTYIPTILTEERGLAYAFPDTWPVFKKQTPRFFPALWRVSAYRDIRWSLQQWLRNREYRGALTVVLVLVLLAVYSNR